MAAPPPPSSRLRHMAACIAEEQEDGTFTGTMDLRCDECAFATNAIAAGLQRMHKQIFQSTMFCESCDVCRPKLRLVRHLMRVSQRRDIHFYVRHYDDGVDIEFEGCFFSTRVSQRNRRRRSTYFACFKKVDASVILGASPQRLLGAALHEIRCVLRDITTEVAIADIIVGYCVPLRTLHCK